MLSIIRHRLNISDKANLCLFWYSEKKIENVHLNL